MMGFGSAVMDAIVCDLKCTNIQGRNIPDTFYCENCV